uniref:6-phosphogluconate dehydrogenase, decarboxylating n=1 Tax=Euglena gracilis TaxID=3039 RepID=B2NIV9_EUGGR|nr:6-phosphogluconate dehydrogenase [Euglena gracilis]
MSCDVGLYGLAVMGQNFALNMAEHGFTVAVCNRSPGKVDDTVERAKGEGNLPLLGFKDPKDFVQALKRPRRIVILVQAGKPVDDTIAHLSGFLEAGDLIVDGGNEWFPNSQRRAELLRPKGILFMGMGISGGEEGARKGPSLMPGGEPGAYELMEPIITKCAAQVDDGPCTFNIGPVGSGNYVKMVHNGIEYGDMQMIAETYDLLKQLGGLTNAELATTFTSWNETELASFLIEITGIIFTKADDQGAPGELVDYILDKTGMKGTGRWTIQEAAERNSPACVMAAALDARYISARKDERVAAEAILKGPTDPTPAVDKAAFVADVRAALFCSKVVSYAQGMNLIRSAGQELGWPIDLAECARIWKGGCIIRAAFLDDIKKAFQQNPALPNLLVDPYFSSMLNSRTAAWRRVVQLAVVSGIAAPAISAALAYFDSYRRGSLPANLTQAQRDFFGGHSYQRTDRDGVFHCEWTSAHKAIGNIAERTRGNL